MKNIGFRLIGFAVLLLISALAIRGYLSRTKDNIILKDRIVQRDDSLQYYQDKFGREHAVRLQLQADIGSVRSHYKKETDSLITALGIKEKQLQSFTVTGTVTAGAVTAPIDSVPGSSERSFRYQDRWLTMDGRISDSIHLRYQYRDSLYFATYWKRSWFLGRKRYYQDGYSLNPSTHISGLVGAEVPVRVPGRFGVGPEVGYTWDGTRWRFSLGISLHYSLIRF